MSSGADIAVVGGGLHGLSAALNLARAGQRVILLEREWIGRHASGASAAGVRTLGRKRQELALSLELMEMWHRIETIVGDDCGFHAYGQLRLATTEDDLQTLRVRVEALHADGYKHEQMIDADELREILPGVAPHFLGGIYAPRDGAADPHKTIRAFRAACAADGVDMREGEGVVAIEPAGDDWRVHTPKAAYDVATIVNAAGAWGARVAAMVGDTFKLGAKASMMMVTERVAPIIRPVVSVEGRMLSLKQSDKGTLILGGGIQGRYDLDAGRTFIDFRGLARAAANAREVMPAIGDVRITRCWSGIEAKTADLLPVIGPSSAARGVIHVFGFSGHGFQPVPAVGAAVARMVVEGIVPETLSRLGVDRLQKESEAA